MPKKSCDLGPIPASVLYDCLDEILPIVTSSMNKSLSSGIVPQCFKHALVKPLLKKKASLDPNCLKHYRPVSSLPFLSKVLEHIVLKQFLHHLQSHSLLEPFHSAYRKCHSTETALLRVVNDLLQGSDSGCVSILSLQPLTKLTMALFVGCLTSQQHASVPQGRICSDNFTCCYTEIEVADQTFYLTHSQYTDTGPSSPSADPITPSAWQGILITRLRSTFGCSGTVLD